MDEKFVASPTSRASMAGNTSKWETYKPYAKNFGSKLFKHLARISLHIHTGYHKYNGMVGYYALKSRNYRKGSLWWNVGQQFENP
jgi:hypothetical protein